MGDDKVIDLAKARARRDDAAVVGLLAMAAEAAHDHHLSRAQFTRAATIAFLGAGRSPAVTVAPMHHDREAEAKLAAELDRLLPGQIGVVAISRLDDGLWSWRWELRGAGWTKRLEQGLPAQASSSGHVLSRELAHRAAVAALRALVVPSWRQRLGRALAGAAEVVSRMWLRRR